MSGIVIKPMPKVFHRYKPAEMSGALPPVLYKILSKKYAHRLLDDGEMMWSSLTWFQHEEHSDRRDEYEASRRYFPVTGLTVKRSERDGRPDDATFTLPSDGFVAKAAQSDHIFIYSMTLDSTFAVGDPSTRACVEIFDPPQFVQRVKESLERHRKARMETFIHDGVRYWSPATPPEAVWALPDRLTMHKHEDFEWQREYRFAFGIRADVFDFENVECFIVGKEARWQRRALDPQSHRMKFRLGPLADCCRPFHTA